MRLTQSPPAACLLQITMLLAAGSGAAVRAEPLPNPAADRAAAALRTSQFQHIRGMLQGNTPVHVIVQFSVANLDALNSASRSARGPARIAQADLQLSAAIAGARQVELARLANTAHTVVRTYDTVPFVAMTVSAAALAALEQSPGIVGITEDHVGIPLLNNTVNITGASAAWNDGYDGTGWYVAVLDTGIRDTHNAFAGKTIVQACFSLGQDGIGPAGDCPNGLVSDTTSPHAAQHFATSPTSDHGTHVSCIAAGNDPGHPLYGIARGANLIEVQVFSQYFNEPVCNNNTGGDCVMYHDSDILAGLVFVYGLRTTHAIASVNMSVGGATYWNQADCDADSAAIKAAIDNLRGADIATVVAAGNGSSCAQIDTPGCISSAIAVGATTDADVETSFSDNHPALLDIFAPGENIFSALANSDSTYGNLSGTSMATPHVAGAWAILQQALPGAEVSTVLSALQATGTAVTGRCAQPTAQKRIQIDQAIDYLQGLEPECTDPPGSDPRPIWTQLAPPDGSGYPDYITVTTNLQIVKTLKLLASVLERGAQKLQDLASQEDPETKGRCQCSITEVQQDIMKKDCTLATNGCTSVVSPPYPVWLPTDVFKNINNTARFAFKHLSFLDGVRNELLNIASALQGLGSDIENLAELVQKYQNYVDEFTEGYHLGGYSIERPELHLCVGYGGHGAFAEMLNLFGEVSIGGRYTSHNLSKEHRAQFRSGGFAVNAFGRAISILPGIEFGLQMDGFKLWDANKPFGTNMNVVGDPSCTSGLGFKISDFENYDIFDLVDSATELTPFDTSGDGCLQPGEFIIHDFYTATYKSADGTLYTWPRPAFPFDWEKQNTAVFAAGLNLPIKMKRIEKRIPPSGIVLFPGATLYPMFTMDAGVEWSMKAYGLRTRLQDMINKNLPAVQQLGPDDFERPMHNLQAPDTSGDEGTTAYVRPRIAADLLLGIPLGRYLMLGITASIGTSVRVEPGAYGGVHDFNIALTDTLLHSNPPRDLPCDPIVESTPTVECTNTFFLDSNGEALSSGSYTCDTNGVVAFHCQSPEEDRPCTPASAFSDCPETHECVAVYGCTSHGYCTRIISAGPDGLEGTADDVVQVQHDTTYDACAGNRVCMEPAPNAGAPCDDPSDCALPKRCAGGPNANNPCATNANCPESQCASPTAPCEAQVPPPPGYFTPYQCLVHNNPEIIGWEGPGCSPLTFGFASACGCATDADCVAGEETCVDGACSAGSTPVECSCDSSSCPDGRICIDGGCLRRCTTDNDCSDGQKCDSSACVNTYDLPFAEQIVWQTSHTTKPQHAVSTYALSDILASVILDAGLWIGLDLKIFKKSYHFDVLTISDAWTLAAFNKTWYQAGLEARYQNECDPISGNTVTNWQPGAQQVKRYNPNGATTGSLGNAGTEPDLLQWCSDTLPIDVANPDAPTNGDLIDSVTDLVNWGEQIGIDAWSLGGLCVTHQVEGLLISEPFNEWLESVNNNPGLMGCRYTFPNQTFYDFPCSQLRSTMLLVWGCLDVNANPWAPALAAGFPGNLAVFQGNSVFNLNSMLIDPNAEFTLDNLKPQIRHYPGGFGFTGTFWYTAVEQCFEQHYATIQPGDLQFTGVSIGPCCGNSVLNQQGCGQGAGSTPCEQCDDGNHVAGDGCSPLCRLEESPNGPRCGDGIVQAGLGEECDDGNTNGGDGCEPDCTRPHESCPGMGLCILPHATPGCSDPACCPLVCAIDPACCTVAWSAACAQIAVTQCDACIGQCVGGSYCDNPECCVNPNDCVCYAPWDPISQALCPQDCNTNGIPDAQERDCNGNHFPDDCDIAQGLSQDENLNHIPDECECPGSGIPGDINMDGQVNLQDIIAFLTCYGGPVTYAGCPCSDFNVDGHVDLRDFAVFQASYGTAPAP